ncbi:MauE/DoxX family redox-associated membrane protein [Catenulispora subtropica]|uniref:Methylamine utilisation protein MauE domain-containing protein n=1 Tax=Catenulispora subtropica TaxID=450798 RepID=A0ABN2S5Q8_9ACTN
MTWTAQAQPLFLAGVLGWSGLAKTVGGDPRGRVAGTALHRLLGARLAPAAYLALGAGEALLALALLVAPGRPTALAAAALACGFLGYLGYAVVATPQASCGCLGKKKAKLSWRAFARAGLLLAAAVVAAVDKAPQWWQSPPLTPLALLLLAETALFVMLSAELDRLWLTPLRRLRVRVTRPLSGAPDEVPLQATLSALVRSPAYREASPWLASDVLEHWDADGWRILVYGARLPDRRATAVFAVPLEGFERAVGPDLDAIRVTLVDEAEVPGEVEALAVS